MNRVIRLAQLVSFILIPHSPKECIGCRVLTIGYGLIFIVGLVIVVATLLRLCCGIVL
jgi:hypothetical protein